MDFFEIVLLIVSGIYTITFLIQWYKHTLTAWPSERVRLVQAVFILLPVVSFAIIIYTLKVLASFDVVDDFIYLLMYLLIGFAWIYFGLRLMFSFFDISWIDDVLNQNNKAALCAVTGAFSGITLIYSGANIGSGPGWWCVFFAGGLGVLAWFLLLFLIHLTTKIFDRITIGRDLSAGIRLGSYMLSAGLILARASGGDWTSFGMTVVEFSAGWPVLILTVFMIIIERCYIYRNKDMINHHNESLYGSIFLGILYIAFAVISLMKLIPPMTINPNYQLSWVGCIPEQFPKEMTREDFTY